MSKLIPREFINQLLSRCDLVELIDSRIPLKKKGGNYAACCPFHNEKTPSFTVSPNKQIYHCFGCHASGNAIGFLIDYEKLSFVEAVEQLAQQLGMAVPKEVSTKVSNPIEPDLYQILEQAAVYYQKQLREHQSAIDYLKKRGLSGQIAKTFGIGYAPAGWDNLLNYFGNNKSHQLLATGLVIKKSEGIGYYDRFRDRIMFPIRDRRGRVIGFGGRIIETGEPKYLNSPETAVFHKGHELYGIYEVSKINRQPKYLIIVEGYMDVVALAQHEIYNAVATLGTATSAEHIKNLFRLTSEIIFCFDGDAAGQAAAYRALETVLPLLQDGWQIKFLLLPKSEDPDSLIRKFGKAEFENRLDQAISLDDFLFLNLSKEINLNTVDGRARLTKLAVPLLNKIPDNIFKHMLFERLANLVRMESETLKTITQNKIKTTKPDKILNKNKKTVNLKRSPMRLAIALLLQHPQLAHSIKNINQIENLILPGSDLLQEVISQAQQATDINTAVLLEHWRERPELLRLQQLATWEIGIPESGTEAELMGVLDKLLEENRNGRMDELLQKAKLISLSDEEKSELQLLIIQK